MEGRTILRIAAITLAVSLGGCAVNPGIIKTGQDTYLLTRTDKGGVFDDIASTKANVVREANEFAASQNKAAVSVGLKSTPMDIQGFTSIEYQFRLVDKTEAKQIEAKQAEAKSLATSSNNAEVVTSKSNSKPLEVKEQEQANHPKDIYTILIQYDELRKRGIISESEFEVLKKKAISGN